MNIIDLVKGYINPNLISKVSSELGESDTGISKAMSAYLPILLGSLVDKGSSTNGLFHAIKSFGASRGLSNISTTQETPDNLISIIATLLGNNTQPIIAKVAEFAGISTASSSKLLDLTALTTFGSIGKEAEFNNLTERDFFSQLAEMKDKIVGLIPAGLGLGALGLGSFFTDKPNISETATETVEPAKEKIKDAFAEVKDTVKPEEKPFVEPIHSSHNHNENNSGGGFWKWIIPLIILGLAAFFLLKYCKDEDKNVTTDTEVITDSAIFSTDSIESTKELSTIDLDGIALSGYANGLEDQIIKFIKMPEFANLTEDQLKDKWFNFDNVNFVFGKTDQLEAGSEVQLDNVTAILKKYPNAKIKLGAYTDKVGDDTKNKEISQKRADYLKAELAKRGVGAQVVSAEGYGEEFATVAETASDEERASDRKMSLRFTK